MSLVPRQETGATSGKPASTTPAIPAADPCLVILAVLWAIVLSAGWPVRQTGGAAPRATALAAIDPNRAPWWELALLPRIGEDLARRIVRYRDSVTATGAAPTAFSSAADLARVRGIGPVIVRRIAPHLAFQQPSRSSSNSAVRAPPW